jgi:hypothetical protein
MSSEDPVGFVAVSFLLTVNKTSYTHKNAFHIFRKFLKRKDITTSELYPEFISQLSFLYKGRLLILSLCYFNRNKFSVYEQA